MKNLIKIILESVNDIKKFEDKYDLSLPEDITDNQLKDLKEAFTYLPKNFIKHHIKNIVFADLGAVHGKYIQEPKKGHIIINPTIFENKKYFKIGDDKVPVKYFTIIHEIGHMFDHLKKISDTKKWINLSHWEEVDINKPTPKGYKRYIEKRKGRDIPGHKKSGWVHDENAEFVRNYASKNPKEDFADTFAFVVLGKEFNFKGNGNKKIEIIKDYLR
jgi:hypothetical protein